MHVRNPLLELADLSTGCLKAAKRFLVLGLDRAALLRRLPQLLVCVLQVDVELKHLARQTLLLFNQFREDAVVHRRELRIIGGSSVIWFCGCLFLIVCF